MDNVWRKRFPAGVVFRKFVDEALSLARGVTCFINEHTLEDTLEQFIEASMRGRDSSDVTMRTVYWHAVLDNLTKRSPSDEDVSLWSESVPRVSIQLWAGGRIENVNRFSPPPAPGCCNLDQASTKGEGITSRAEKKSKMQHEGQWQEQ